MSMATRDDTKDQTKAADEAARTARTVTDEAARVGEQTARAGAAVFRRNTETARDTLQAGLNTATQTFQRMTDQFNQTLGFNGPQAEELARRSSQNLQAVTQASTVLARGFQEASNEVFRSAQDRLQKNMDALNQLAGCRSVQDFVAVQSDLVQFQRTCWWSGSRRSHPKCWCTRSMSSWAVNGPSGSTMARLPCDQRGSIGLSQGLFTGKRHTRIRTPPVRFTRRLCVQIHARTARLTCQAALSHTSTHTRLPSSASWPAPQARKSVVMRLTGRPSTKRSSTRS